MTRTVQTCLLFLLLVLAGPTPGFAQADNTGTNPVNFTYDARFYTEMASLDGGGSLLTNTFELRWPLGRNVANVRGDQAGSFFQDMGQFASLRFQGRHAGLSVPTPGIGPFGTSEVSGIGDFDVRLLTLAYTSPNLIIAAGVEAFFDTATHDALGSGKTSLGPQAFAIFPGVLGGNSLFAPGYQYVFDVAGDDDRSDIRRSQIDLYFVWLLAGGRNWLIVDPQIILDHESGKELANIETELGFMIAPSAGASTYVRPGWGVTEEKLYAWNLEVGLKFVWR